MDNIFTRYSDMPGTIHSFVVSNPDDTYTVILNSKLSNEMQLAAYIHELQHIQNGDYNRKCSVDLIEINAHAHNG